MGIKIEFEEAEIQVLMQYIDFVVKAEGLAQAENAIHLTRILKAGYDAASDASNAAAAEASSAQE